MFLTGAWAYGCDAVRVVRDDFRAVRVVKDVMGDYHGVYAEAAVKGAGGVGLVLYLDDAIAGAAVGYVARGRVDLGVLYYIVVEPIFRRRGLSRVLISSLEYVLEDMGARVFYTTVERGNAASLRAFSSMCYRVFEAGELADVIGYSALLGLLHAACSYEDELVLVKDASRVLHVLSRVELDDFKDLWWEACYKPWVERWYPRRLGALG